jgi:hypothetical protein
MVRTGRRFFITASSECIFGACNLPTRLGRNFNLDYRIRVSYASVCPGRK